MLSDEEHINFLFDRFSLDSTTGVLSSATSMSAQTYRLRVRASDRGNFIHNIFYVRPRRGISRAKSNSRILMHVRCDVQIN